MSKLRWLSLLMVITIVAVTGFQVYWLKENYDREKNSLALRSQFHFREAILELQVAKMNFPAFADSTEPGVRRVIVNKDDNPVSIRVKGPRTEMVSTFNVVRSMARDSLKKGKKPLMIMGSSSIDIRDSMYVDRRIGAGPGHVFNLLYGVDSLQDSIRVAEVDSLLRNSLAQEGIDIPFEIKKYPFTEGDEGAMNKITLGIREPVTYEFVPGNTFPYLLREITLPILFSLLLLGITITSFILLYRNFVKQKKLAELKNEFISNVTHELKTPIATAGVAIEALKSFNAIHDPQKTQEYLDISSNELQRLGLLVDKVLRLSMFEKNDVGIRKEELDLGELVDEVTTSLRIQFEKYNARVDVNKEGDLHLEGDKLHLLSVVFNLVDNALKYSPAEPAIQINIKGNGDFVELEVSDRGIGVPREYREKIFEKFFRVPHGNTHNAKGHGLGLSYVSYVVKNHGGDIQVSDGEQGGTKFKIILPKR